MFGHSMKQSGLDDRVVHQPARPKAAALVYLVVSSTGSTSITVHGMAGPCISPQVVELLALQSAVDHYVPVDHCVVHWHGIGRPSVPTIESTPSRASARNLIASSGATALSRRNIRLTYLSRNTNFVRSSDSATSIGEL